LTHQQALAFALVGVTIALFVWGRFRYDLVSLAALLASVFLGLTPAKHAFDGFANEVVVIIACALIVSAGFARSGVVEAILRPITSRLTRPGQLAPVFIGVTAALSMTTKNVGALALLMPMALQSARRIDMPASRLLMPMSFASLLGGLVTLVGTSPNIIVSDVRERLFGHPFGMYDFTPVGLGLTAIGVVVLALAYRVLPTDRRPAETIDTALAESAYVTEVDVPQDWSADRPRVGDLIEQGQGEVMVIALIRDGSRRDAPHPNIHIRPGDKLLLEGGHEELDRLIARARFKLTRSDRPVFMEGPTEEVRVIESVVSEGSPLIGESARRLDLHAAQGINVLAVSRSGYRLRQSVGRVRFRAGDIVMLQGGERSLPSALKALGLLPLAEREVRLGVRRRVLAPVFILAAAMLAIGFHVVPVAIAFFAAAVAMLLIGGLTVREAYAALDGPVLILIAALIPVGEAIHATGGADLVARYLSGPLGHMPSYVSLATIMLLSMISAPFMHNAPTVLVFGPIAASLAQRLGLNPDAFLMAVAVGAACDFLTPIGHQCNTLVMAPGGYRFSDYPRLGAPLSAVVLFAGTALIAAVWGLHR
jgi:di/tricarboxylate transporter